MRCIDNAPASVSSMATTIARRGRSMKTPEIILRLSHARVGWRWRGRAGADLDAGPDALDPLGDHHLALLQPAGDHGRGGRRLAQLDPPLLHLVVGADNIDVVPLLVGQHRLARNAKR